MSIWVLTSEVNEYDQFGEYFEYGWAEKPTKEMVLKRLPKNAHKDIDHIMEGGGRLNDSYEWYNFYKVL
jgi:hypothetical protein